ncbi:MAG: hypothetical protein M3480_05080 [Verrucomicrobiota bacterium]|nr:hypothetical protein [Chthoniobacterales bacterium]MDQ3414336.1 hypothetical protein [Verrucomicrobiota bacterium]
MTAEEVYESVTSGGASDFAVAVEIFGRFGAWCLIGGLAVNCYAEPVYTVDADFVMVARDLDEVQGALAEAGFSIQTFPHLVNARRAGSQLNLQLTTDPRYQDIPERAERREVLGRSIPVAALADVVQGKIWAWEDPERRLTKRKKDELDLLRLAEANPALRPILPQEIACQLESEREEK